jgi:hypothetical protein
MTWKRRGGRKVILAPDGAYAWALATAAGRDADPRAGAGASVEADVGGGEVSVGWELAEAEGGVTRRVVNRLLRLTLLAPGIVQAILEGRQPKVMQLEELTDAIPSEWEKQRKALLSGAA